ncbi:MAG: Ig-like domain-containing protein, partial [Thermoanaerobaculia bacterium]
ELFDPPHGSTVTSNQVTLAGRSGGAAGVKVNGTTALVSSDSFCATIELPLEGDNVVAITCTDPSGNPTGTTATIVLRRVTGEPSLAITSPTEGSVTAAETVSVTGVATGAASVEVNGALAALTGEAFSVTGVRLTPGLNIVSAVARSASGRMVSASRRVLHLKDAPSLTITSPATAITTGASSIDVSGLWSNLDPSTITITAGGSSVTVTATSFSETNGSFVAASVPLTTGQQTVVVEARDLLGRTATATIPVTVAAGNPSIAISEPADNRVFASTDGDSFVVRGTFTAAPGAVVEVGGAAATLDSATTFSATVPFVPGRMTPVIARVTAGDGGSAIDTIRVTRAATKPSVVERFPAENAVQVDPSTMPMILFSAAMDRASTAPAFRLENAAGTAVSGTLRLDRDVLTFAPSAHLTAGERYTMRLETSARALSSDPLGSELSSSFTVSATAPRTPPVLSNVPASVCASTLTVAGTAPAGARLRIDLGTLAFATTASADGTWSYQLPIGGLSGHQVVRVRVVTADGAFSPATESCFVVDCDGPRVIGASFDRSTNRITVTFSKAIKPESAASSFRLQLPDGRNVPATVALQTPPSAVALTPAEDLKSKTFTLTVETTIEDLGGKKLAFPFSQQFAFGDDADPVPGDGSGYISGEVFDAETGRPLPGVTVTVIDAPLETTTDSRGRYSARAVEGAHTLRLALDGYTTAWRQLIVPPGVGVNPVDVRLTPRGSVAIATTGALTLVHRDTALRIPEGGVATGAEVALTHVGAQSL